jgi:transposase
VLRSGGRWIDAPAEYGPRKTLYNLYVRWAAKGGLGRGCVKTSARFHTSLFRSLLRGLRAFRVEKIEKNLALLDRLQNFAEFLHGLGRLVPRACAGRRAARASLDRQLRREGPSLGFGRKRGGEKPGDRSLARGTDDQNPCVDGRRMPSALVHIHRRPSRNTCRREPSATGYESGP